MSLNQSIPITVVPSPVAQVSVSPTPTDVDSPVNFSVAVSGGTGPYTYAWLFGDGANSSLASPEHTYANPGSFLVQVWVNDSQAKSAYSSTTLTVNPALGATVAAAPTSAETGRAIGFWANETGGTAPYAVAWRFGDGSVGNGTHPVHAYSTSGDYSVGVWVNDSVGQSVHQTLTLTVTQGPTVSGSATPSTTDTGLPVAFDATVTGGIPPYSVGWAFGGGASATGPSVSHAFTLPGAWRVTVWGNDSAGGVSEQSFTVQVQPPPAISVFAISSSQVRAVSPVRFTVTASGGTGTLAYSYSGLPGGCSSANVANLTCTPTQGGVFNVTVTVTDAVGGSTTGSVGLVVTTSGASSGFLGLTGVDWLWVIIVVAAAVLIVFAGLLLVSRSGRGGRSPPKAGKVEPGPPGPTSRTPSSGPRSP
jgi:PKD repeat protein